MYRMPFDRFLLNPPPQLHLAVLWVIWRLSQPSLAVWLVYRSSPGFRGLMVAALEHSHDYIASKVVNLSSQGGDAVAHVNMDAQH